MDQIEAKRLVRRHCADLTAEQREAVYAALRARTDVQTGRRALRDTRVALGFGVGACLPVRNQIQPMTASNRSVASQKGQLDRPEPELGSL